MRAAHVDALLRFLDEHTPDDDIIARREEEYDLAVVEDFEEWDPKAEDESWLEDDRRQELRDDV